MLRQFFSFHEALRILMMMTLGALGLFRKDSSQPKLLLLLPTPSTHGFPEGSYLYMWLSRELPLLVEKEWQQEAIS